MTGAHAAGRIWSDFIKNTQSHSAGTKFPDPPPEVISVAICSLTGLRPSPDCPDVIHEYFVNRTAPTNICPTHSDRLSLLMFLYGDRLFDTGIMYFEDESIAIDRSLLGLPDFGSLSGSQSDELGNFYPVMPVIESIPDAFETNDVSSME